MMRAQGKAWNRTIYNEIKSCLNKYERQKINCDWALNSSEIDCWGLNKSAANRFWIEEKRKKKNWNDVSKNLEEK